jgi:hypothetical protein
MKKKVKDITFKEFCSWANDRACDGQWSAESAIWTSFIIRNVYEVKSLFFRKRKREQRWQEFKRQLLNPEVELTIN